MIFSLNKKKLLKTCIILYRPCLKHNIKTFFKKQKTEKDNVTSKIYLNYEKKTLRLVQLIKCVLFKQAGNERVIFHDIFIS